MMTTSSTIKYEVGDIVTPNALFYDFSDHIKKYPPPWTVESVRPSNVTLGEWVITVKEIQRSHQYYAWRFDRVDTIAPYDPSQEPDDDDDV